MRLLLYLAFSVSLTLMVLSWWVYLPWFLRLLKKRDEGEFERAGAQTFPSTSRGLDICYYLIKKRYERSFDASVRRHGAILRWTLAFPLMLASLTLLVAFAAESLLQR